MGAVGGRPDRSPLGACLAGQRRGRLPAHSARLACCWGSAETLLPEVATQKLGGRAVPFRGQADFSPT